ncbi:MAG TPA: cytochrome c [Solirubrobacteraceae bacterium]
MRMRLAALTGLVVVLALAGCGSSGSGSHASSAAPGPVASVSGHEVFSRQCAFCHSLSGHSTPKQQGGDLLGIHLQRPVLTQYTAEMPVRHKLSRAQLKAVVDYVLAVQRGG